MNDLNQLILQWADDKGILANGTPEGQIAKTIEELMETAQAVALYDLVAESYHFNDEDANERLEHVKDGIGDVYVTLVIHANMTESPLEYEAESRFSYAENKTIFEEIAALIIRIMTGNRCLAYVEIFYLLANLANNHRLTLRECVEHSYNVIAKRNGTMIDGVFIRDN